MVVGIKLGAGFEIFRPTVEVGKQIDLVGFLPPSRFRLRAQPLDDLARMDFFLDVDGRRIDDEIGTLRPNRWADFIVLTENPLDDIRNARSIESVWIAGEALR